MVALVPRHDRRHLLRLAFALPLAALAASCAGEGTYADPSRRFAPPRDAGADHPVTVHRPASLAGLQGTVETPQGRPVEVACATCHAVLSPPPALPDDANHLGGPHAGLRFDHGGNACRACHDPARFDRLHLATGESIPMADALRLCTQCHGTQHRDWRHGAHGGMNGHWDLTRGPRLRNHCVDCHDPHAPRFPSFRPLPPPPDSLAARSHHGD